MNDDYFTRFCLIFVRCLHEGYSTADARNFAELELTENLFHETNV